MEHIKKVKKILVNGQDCFIILLESEDLCYRCKALVQVNCYAIYEGKPVTVWMCRDCCLELGVHQALGHFYGPLATWLKEHPCPGDCESLHLTAALRFNQ